MTYAAEVTADSPTLWWRLGELGGTIAVDTAAGRNGIYSGGVTLGTTGLVGDSDTAVTFNGTNAKVTGQSLNLSGSAATIEAVILPASVTGIRQICGIETQFGFQSNSFSLRANGTSLEALLGDGTGRVATATSALSIGTKHHVAARFDGSAGTFRLYLDGSLVASTAANATFTANQQFMAGARVVSDRFFSGVLDEVAFYPSALSDARIAAHYLASTIQQTNLTQSSVLGGAAFLAKLSTAALTQSSTLGAVSVGGAVAALSQVSVLFATPAGAVTRAGAAALSQPNYLTALAVVLVDTPLGPWVSDLSRSAGFSLPVSISLSVEEADDPLEATVIVRQRFSEEYPDPVLVDGRPT